MVYEKKKVQLAPLLASLSGPLNTCLAPKKGILQLLYFAVHTVTKTKAKSSTASLPLTLISVIQGKEENV